MKTEVFTYVQMLKTQASKDNVFQGNKVRRSEDKFSTEVQMLKTKFLKIQIVSRRQS